MFSVLLSRAYRPAKTLTVCGSTRTNGMDVTCYCGRVAGQAAQAFGIVGNIVGNGTEDYLPLRQWWAAIGSAVSPGRSSLARLSRVCPTLIESKTGPNHFVCSAYLGKTAYTIPDSTQVRRSSAPQLCARQALVNVNALQVDGRDAALVLWQSLR